MKRAFLGAALCALAVGGCGQKPREPAGEIELDRLLSFCQSRNIAEAEKFGDALAWQRMSRGDLADWSSGWRRMHPGAQIEAVGWRRHPADKDGGLSFRIVTGESAHRACDYSTDKGPGLRQAIERKFGKPQEVIDVAGFTTMSWRANGLEVTFGLTPAAAGSVVVVSQL
jgi:hypothetical protein